MKLILIRHGDAGAYTLPDHARNLSDIGKQQAQQTADWLAKNHSPTLFISSPYNRAKQTCEIVQQHFPHVEYFMVDNITPDDDPQIAINTLSELLADIEENACVVVVCHMNIIAYMASILTGEKPAGFQLAEARVLEMEIVAEYLGNQIGQFIPT